MENIDNVRLFVQNLDASITNLETSLVPLLKKSLLELTTVPSQSHIDKIKIYNNYAYVLTSTIYSYLKSIGIDTDSHPIKQELNRMKSYMNRLKSLEKGEVASEKQKEIAEDQAKKFLARTLGVKSVGGAVGNIGPAISFKGTHTKFEEASTSKDTSKETSKETTKHVKVDKVKTDKVKNKVKKSKGKISKPKSKKSV